MNSPTPSIGNAWAIQEPWNIRPRFRVDAMAAVLPVRNYCFFAIDGIRFKLLLENGFR
jgi:hypothetical protein